MLAAIVFNMLVRWRSREGRVIVCLSRVSVSASGSRHWASEAIFNTTWSILVPNIVAQLTSNRKSSLHGQSILQIERTLAPLFDICLEQPSLPINCSC